ncbi:MAG: hypothetical protein ACYS99_16415, partial [Planctomycetota bacterium]
MTGSGSNAYGYIVEWEKNPNGPSGTIKIDSGAVATNSTSVTLAITWEKSTPEVDPEVEEMRLRNVGDAWGNWISVAASKSWNLVPGEGTKTVEAQFRDAAGTTSTVVSDSILLDQTAPWGTVLIADNLEWVGDRHVDLTLWYDDGLSGVTEMRFRDGSDGEWGSWVGAATTSSRTLPPGDGEKRVEGQYRDAAGNVSSVNADVVKLDTTPPTCSVVIEGGARFTANRTVTLEITADDGEGSGVADMSVKPSTRHEWLGWMEFAETYHYPVTPGDGSKPLDVKVRDHVGNESLVAEDAIVLDQTGPVLDSFTINGGRPYVLPSEELEFEVFARDNLGGSGLDGLKASFDGG